MGLRADYVTRPREWIASILAREPRFLAGVLEHMLGDESLLIAFATSAGIDPAEVARARSALGGGRKWERDVP